MELIVTLHGQHAATLDAADDRWLDADNTSMGATSARISAAWTEKPATGQLNCWLDGCLPENGLLARYRARAQSMLQTAGGAYKTPKVAEILWANADAEFAGAVRFDIDRSPSAAHVSGYERLTESEIGNRLGEADRIARGLARGTKLPHALEGFALSGMRGKIGLTMLEDGGWAAAYGHALHTGPPRPRPCGSRTAATSYALMSIVNPARIASARETSPGGRDQRVRGGWICQTEAQKA